jgi:DNA (cytosine-5)-methyltransferase 3A
MSCGQIVLKELHIPVENYFASEIYDKAIQVTQSNFPDTIQCGNLLNLYKNEEWLHSLPTIDLILFGFPCRNNSKAVKGRAGYDDGLQGDSSWLFYPCADIVDWIKTNNNSSVLFLCENVDGMTDQDRNIVSSRLGVNYIHIDSNLFSAADRSRLYWTNIKYNEKELPQSNDFVLGDILDDSVSEEFYYNCGFDFHGIDKKVCATLHLNGHDILKRVNNPLFKGATLTSCRGGNLQKKVYDIKKQKCRKLTPNEYRKLQTIPEWYIMNVAKSHIYNMCGDGWTIKVIEWFFKYI